MTTTMIMQLPHRRPEHDNQATGRGGPAFHLCLETHVSRDEIRISLVPSRRQSTRNLASMSALAITRFSKFVSAKLQDCPLLSPPVIHSVHIGAVESVPVRALHGDALGGGFVAVGAHLSVRVSACQIHTSFHSGSAGESESVDRVEKPVETDIGRLASAHHAELHIACLRAAFRPKPSHTHGMMHYKSWNLAWALLSGMLNALGAWALFVALKNGGKASIVAPLTALYPLVVIALVPLVLRESVTRLQFVGVASAQIAVVLLSI